MAPEDVVIDGLGFGSELDFHNRDLKVPIEIRVVFSFSDAERDALLHDVVSEVPEMRNAVEGLDRSLLLSISIQARHIPSADGPLIYVREIAFVQPEDVNSQRGHRIVLQLGPEAASELQSRRTESQRLRARARGLQYFLDRFDAEDWARLARRGSEGESSSAPLSYYLREFTGSLPSGIAGEIRALVTRSRSYEELQTNVLSQLSELQSEAELYESTALTTKVSTITGEVTKVPLYINKLLARLSGVGLLHLRERRKDIGAEEAQRLLNLKVSRGGPEVLRGIQEIVQSLLGVQVDAFSVGAADGDIDRLDRRRPPPRQRAELDVDNFLVEANGAGIREALRIILDYEFEHPHLVLIEEPEIHLHPALETSMLRYLKTLSKVCQVFIATHSTNFLDTADIGNVYLISKKAGTTTAKLLGNEEIVEEVPPELGLRLSSLFMFDRLIFVEGTTDEAILREVANDLGRNLASVNIGFIPMGGGRNIAHFASEGTISFLVRRQVKCWFVLDRDEKDEEEIVKMKERLKDHAELCILGKREIENYLLIPRAIAEYMERRLDSENRERERPSSEQIQKDMEECAEELREVAVYKRLVKRLCGPSFSQLASRHEPVEDRGLIAIEEDLEIRIEALKKRREAVPELAEAIKGELETDWAARRFDIVPGEELLRKVFARYGLGYKKERDGIGLAASLKTDEVHGDLRTIVQHTCAA
jgi:putative ATP-dependent endonuclease of the OLD family